MFQLINVFNSFIMLFLDKSPKFAAALRNDGICPKLRQTAKIALIAASAILRISSDPSDRIRNEEIDVELNIIQTRSSAVSTADGNYTYVGKPSAIGQPTRSTQPVIISGSIDE